LGESDLVASSWAQSKKRWLTGEPALVFFNELAAAFGNAEPPLAFVVPNRL